MSHGVDDLRRLHGDFHAGTAAQIDVLAVTKDGNATEHQGFQAESGHCRPPTIVDDETT
jgi:hypothetical protein